MTPKVSVFAPYTSDEVLDMIDNNPAEFYDLVPGGIEIDEAYVRMLQVFSDASEVVDPDEPGETYVDDELYARFLEQMLYMVMTDLAFLGTATLLYSNDAQMKAGEYSDMAGEGMGGQIMKMIQRYLYGRAAMNNLNTYFQSSSEYELGKAHEGLTFLRAHMQRAGVGYIEDSIRKVYPHGEE